MLNHLFFLFRPFTSVMCLMIALLIFAAIMAHGWVRVIIFLNLFLVVLCSTPFVPRMALSFLENQYQPLKTIPKVDCIVVLGAGYMPLNMVAFARVLEAVRIHQYLPESTLLISGASAPMRSIYHVDFNIDLNKIHTKKWQLNTYDEALHLKSCLRNQPFILITSAYHMPRAMRIFKNMEMHPIAAVTQPLLHFNTLNSWTQYVPNTINVLYTEIVLREWGSQLLQVFK